MQEQRRSVESGDRPAPQTRVRESLGADRQATWTIDVNLISTCFLQTE
jgi:hypothetical protein